MPQASLAKFKVWMSTSSVERAPSRSFGRWGEDIVAAGSWCEKADHSQLRRRMSLGRRLSPNSPNSPDHSPLVLNETSNPWAAVPVPCTTSLVQLDVVMRVIELLASSDSESSSPAESDKP